MALRLIGRAHDPGAGCFVEDLSAVAQHDLQGADRIADRNQGLIEPLIVRDDTFEVLEGNSRLAAYRFLAKSDRAHGCFDRPRRLQHGAAFHLCLCRILEDDGTILPQVA